MSTPKLIIDVSNLNGAVNFAETKKHGVIGVVLRVTEGLTGAHSVDETFHAHLVQARKAGLIVGAYHFAHQDSRPTIDGARAEAKHYVETMRRLTGHSKAWNRGDFKPVLDFEKGTPDKMYSAWRDAFQAEVKRLTNHDTVLYTFSSFNNWRTPQARNQRRLWVADYDDNPEMHVKDVAKRLAGRTPGIPGGYKSADLWQFSSKLVMPGVHGHVDCSVLRGGPLALRRLRCTVAG